MVVAIAMAVAMTMAIGHGNGRGHGFGRGLGHGRGHDRLAHFRNHSNGAATAWQCGASHDLFGGP